jgi:hypothetical protein
MMYCELVPDGQVKFQDLCLPTEFLRIITAAFKPFKHRYFSTRREQFMKF